jgi:hypothetical protein
MWPWYSLLQSKYWRSLPFWRTKPTESWRRLHWVLGVQDHSSPEEILNFWGSLPITSAAAFQAPKTVWVAKDPQARGSLEAYCEHLWDSAYCLAKHLAGLLGCRTANSPHHVKNSTDFACTLGSLYAGPQDIMVSFDVVLLFTRVPIRKAMSLLSQHFEKDILRLFHHVLKTSCFSFSSQFYEKLTA